jgi:hypothetical protein
VYKIPSIGEVFNKYLLKSLNEYLMNMYYGADTVLGTWDTSINKAKISDCETYILAGGNRQ